MTSRAASAAGPELRQFRPCSRVSRGQGFLISNHSRSRYVYPFADLQQPLDEVERHLAEHRAFLDKHYASGELICSGPCDPRTGGVILCRGNDRRQVETLVCEDPFLVYGIADYQIIGFDPVKSVPGFEHFK